MMLFTPPNIALIEADKKIETRRPLKVGMVVNDLGLYRINLQGKAVAVYLVGHDYAMQPGRGLAGLPSRRLLIKVIRSEPLHAIDDVGAQAEGCADRDAYQVVWSGIYKRGAFQWDKNPTVAVIRYQLLRLSSEGAKAS